MCLSLSSSTIGCVEDDHKLSETRAKRPSINTFALAYLFYVVVFLFLF